MHINNFRIWDRRPGKPSPLYHPLNTSRVGVVNTHVDWCGGMHSSVHVPCGICRPDTKPLQCSCMYSCIIMQNYFNLNKNNWRWKYAWYSKFSWLKTYPNKSSVFTIQLWYHVHNTFLLQTSYTSWKSLLDMSVSFAKQLQIKKKHSCWRC
jgi:hypothetical protein